MTNEILTLLLSIASSAVCGGFSGFVTIYVLKNDIAWIKNIQEQHGKRIHHLEIKECRKQN